MMCLQKYEKVFLEEKVSSVFKHLLNGSNLKCAIFDVAHEDILVQKNSNIFGNSFTCL